MYIDLIINYFYIFEPFNFNKKHFNNKQNIKKVFGEKLEESLFHRFSK